MSKKGEYFKFRNYEKKIKLPFMSYAHFRRFLMPGDNGEQNLKESYTNKYQKHISCSYGYKLVCIEDKYSKLFKTYLDKEAVYNFINNMIKESKYCSEVMKKRFNKELVMTKKKTMKIIRTL